MTDTAPIHHPSSDDRPADPERRRLVLGGVGRFTLGVAALTLADCASVSAPDHPPDKTADDSALLDNVLAVEYQAVAAYESVLAGAILTGGERGMAAAFQADHVKHAEVLVAAITRAGGTAPERSPRDLPFAATELRGRDDALRFLVGIEQGLALAHLAAVPAFTSKGLAKGAAAICGVEFDALGDVAAGPRRGASARADHRLARRLDKRLAPSADRYCSAAYGRKPIEIQGSAATMISATMSIAI